MPIYSLRDILIVIREIANLVRMTRERDRKITEAIVTIQTAVIETRNFIEAQGYQRNVNLSKLWLTAFDKVRAARIYRDDNFPQFLYDKARFWGNPAEWLKEPGAMELVPTLKELENECDILLEKLK